MSKNESAGIIIGVMLLVGICVLFAGAMWGYQEYKVWRAEMNGRASLRQAEQEKLILIETAKAEAEAAKLRAQAIATVGKAAQQYPEYRQQEFMAAFADAIQNGSIDQIIYVPTEANIPVVESQRHFINLMEASK